MMGVTPETWGAAAKINNLYLRGVYGDSSPGEAKQRKINVLLRWTLPGSV